MAPKRRQLPSNTPHPPTSTLTPVATYTSAATEHNEHSHGDRFSLEVGLAQIEVQSANALAATVHRRSRKLAARDDVLKAAALKRVGLRRATDAAVATRSR